MTRSSVLTVAAPVTDRAMTTLATAKDELDITNNKSDARITRWIREESGVIEDHTKRVWVSEAVVETFFASERSPEKLTLNRRPVTAIASVTEDDVALVPGDYLLDAQAGLLIRLDSNGLPALWAASCTVVSYTGGYTSIQALPPGIEKACLRLLQHRTSARGRDPSLRSISLPGLQDESYFGGATDGGLPTEVCDLLEPYIEHRL